MDPDWKEGLSINYISNFVSTVLGVPADSLSNPTFPVLNPETPPAEGDAGQAGESEARPNVGALCQLLLTLPMKATQASDSSMEAQPQEQSERREEARNPVSLECLTGSGVPRFPQRCPWSAKTSRVC